MKTSWKKFMVKLSMLFTWLSSYYKMVTCTINKNFRCASWKKCSQYVSYPTGFPKCRSTWNDAEVQVKCSAPYRLCAKLVPHKFLFIVTLKSVISYLYRYIININLTWEGTTHFYMQLYSTIRWCRGLTEWLITDWLIDS